MDNHTTINVFYLNAFSNNEQLECLLFLLFLILYLLTITGNALIIILTNIDFHLHTPMYFFLKNLSFLDICYISTTLPQMLANILIKHCAISLPACIVQLYFFLALAASESLLLAAMAYDRYVAICNPLRYSVVMNHNICLNMVTGTWVVGSIYGAIHTANTFRLPFCGSGVLNHYFCDIPPLLKISCINTYVNEVTVFAVGGFLMIGCFILIFGSYMHIFISVLNIPKGSGRKKVFSTCVSHLVVVFLFYGSGCFMYMRPKSNLLADKEWLLSIFYTSITPLLNPIIYSLRNKDIKGALQKLSCLNNIQLTIKVL
ncbi:olfactory receptor 2D3-like [Hyperolius riggenbachi]|uniref:olfactory receptor 2D3-like n=1 Tax=Hyperolius riggenbachi TaxID=752182 RepID=UPI0035A2887F